MEYDFYDIFINKLKNIYRLNDENEIYKYLNIRAAIYNNKRKITNNELFYFLLDELNVDVFSDDSLLSNHLIYKNNKYFISDIISEILDNFKFRAEMYGSIDINKEIEYIFKKGYQKAHKYRNTKSYENIRTYNRLILLNEKYNAYPQSSQGIVGFKTSAIHNPMKRTLEESLSTLLLDKDKSNSTAHISEEDLEDYLIQNIELIEKGLIFLKRQVKVKDGFIDILAKDKDGNICVIELKIDKDKRIVWQALHYPEEIKKMYNSNVRMIVIAKYNDSIINALRKVDNIEIYDYNIVADNEIRSLKLNKI